MIYLASPYSHPDPAIREERFQVVCRIAAKLMVNEYDVFSPIAHSHPLVVHGGLCATDHDFWMRRDLPILRRCSAMMVLCLDRWNESRGVLRELEERREINKHRIMPCWFVTETEEPGQPESGSIGIDEWIETMHHKTIEKLFADPFWTGNR